MDLNYIRSDVKSKQSETYYFLMYALNNVISNGNHKIIVNAYNNIEYEGVKYYSDEVITLVCNSELNYIPTISCYGTKVEKLFEKEVFYVPDNHHFHIYGFKVPELKYDEMKLMEGKFSMLTDELKVSIMNSIHAQAHINIYRSILYPDNIARLAVEEVLGVKLPKEAETRSIPKPERETLVMSITS